jgi:hypothetical protein
MLEKDLRCFGIQASPLPEDFAHQDLEDWCLSVCRMASAFMAAENCASKSPFDPIVINQLTQYLVSASPPEPAPTELLVASEMLDSIIAGFETIGITLT